MKHIDDLFKQILKLYDEGSFIRTATIDGKGVSLYKMDGTFHLIWYTNEHKILKYEAIEEADIDPLFSKAEKLPWDEQTNNRTDNQPMKYVSHIFEKLRKSALPDHLLVGTI